VGAVAPGTGPYIFGMMRSVRIGDDDDDEADGVGPSAAVVLASLRSGSVPTFTMYTRDTPRGVDKVGTTGGREEPLFALQNVSISRVWPEDRPTLALHFNYTRRKGIAT